MEPYRDMSRKSYAEALHERLEPVSAAELIYTQYKERSQKPNEVFDLYLRDKYNLFVRSFPQGKTRIFKDFTEEAIRGLHNELLKIKIRDFISRFEKHPTYWQFSRKSGASFGHFADFFSKL